MKRKDLAREVGRSAHLPLEAAQDLVDEVVQDILRKLRAGEPVDLAEYEAQFEKQHDKQAREKANARAGKLKVRPAGQQ